MLNVWLQTKGFCHPERIGKVSEYFDLEYEVEWFDSPMARKIIKTIDKSEYISGHYIESPVLGGISPEQLSTGCKSLLLLLNRPELIVAGERMGDNCYPILFEMAETADYTITLNHFVPFKEPFSFRVLNDNSIVTTLRGYIEKDVEIGELEVQEGESE